MPSYAINDDSGMDIRAFLNMSDCILTDDVNIENAEMVTPLEPLTQYIISTGLRINTPLGYEAQVRPLSELSAKGLLVTIGIINSGGMDDVKVVISNHTKQVQYIADGERIARLVFTKLVWVDLEEVHLGEPEGCGNVF